MFARHQRLVAAPEALKAMRDDREGKISNAAIKLQSQFRGIRDRQMVGKKISQVRVAGALQLLVNELSGNGGGAGGSNKNVGDVAGVLGGLLGVSAVASNVNNNNNNNNNDNETTPPGNRSLFQSTIKKPPRVPTANITTTTMTTNLISNSSSKLSMLTAESKYTTPTPTPTKHSEEKTNKINRLRVDTKDPNDVPTPLMKGMLVDVDLGLGAADKPKVWTPARIVGINTAGDCTVEFERDKSTMSGVLQARVRMRPVPSLMGGATPSTAVLERRQMMEQKRDDGNDTSMSSQRSETKTNTHMIMVDTPEFKKEADEMKSMSRDDSFRSVGSVGKSSGGVLDDSA